MTYVFDILIMIASVMGLWWGAVWLVEGAARVAKRLGMSELTIGLTVVALGRAGSLARAQNVDRPPFWPAGSLGLLLSCRCLARMRTEMTARGLER